MKSKLQTKFGLSYILIIVAVLIVLNSYPLLVSENMMFRSKKPPFPAASRWWSPPCRGWRS